MKVKIILLVFAAALLVFGCKKEKIIKGNEPPPDPTVENILVENYVKNSFLNLLGRLPDATEFDQAFANLKKNNAAKADREAFLKKIMANSAYLPVQFNFESLWLCNGKADDQGYIDYLRDELSMKLANPDYAIQHDQLQRQLDRVNLLDEAKEAYFQGQIDHIELQKRLADNLIFMYENGANNAWIQVAARKFLLREPTDSELDHFYQAENTFETIFFGQSVKSFDELKTVFFDSPEFFEGQVRILFLRYLFREPTAAEIQKYVPDFSKNHDFPALQRAILGSDEFLGI